MRLGRILIDQKEQYITLLDDQMQSVEVTRNNLGIESFFEKDPKPKELEISLQDNDFDWLPPIARPGKILCIGRNYAEHSVEQGKEPETTPLIFSKFSTAMVGHMSAIPYPSHTQAFDYEAELAVIIGKTASKIQSNQDPNDFIFGYTIGNDLTARDVQKSEKQWTRGKAFDGALPIGPFIVTRNEIDDIRSQEIWLTVNGEKRQSSKISHMIFSIPYLVKYISQTITLEPGDVILTGTPAGVGYYMDPIATLQPGDQVACGVTGVGELRFQISNAEN